MRRTSMETSRNLRRGVIEHLDMLASRDEQIRYARSAPRPSANGELSNFVTGELVAMWGDCCGDEPDVLGPAFAAEELAAIREFNVVFERICAAMPAILPPLVEFMESAAWAELAAAAQTARAAFRD